MFFFLYQYLLLHVQFLPTALRYNNKLLHSHKFRVWDGYKRQLRFWRLQLSGVLIKIIPTYTDILN